MFVIERSEDTCNDGLADLATLRVSPTTNYFHDSGKVAQFLDFDDLKEINTAHLEVNT